MKRLYVLICWLCVGSSYAMDIVLCNKDKDFFSEQSNKIRKLLIFPLLETCNTVTDVRNVLLTVGMLSKKSYEQINCIFFTQDCVKQFAKKSDLSDGTIAFHLKTRGSGRYRTLGAELVHYSIMNESYLRVYSDISLLLRQGADINFHSLRFGTTPLMRAVQSNNLQLASYFIKKGACASDCNNDKQSVRSFNVLYNDDRLKKIIACLNVETQRVEKHNDLAKKFRGRCSTCLNIHDCLSVLHESRELYRALCIDKICEDQKAPVVCSDDSHPLMRILSKVPLTRRMIKAVFDNDRVMMQQSIPKNILEALL